MQMIDQFLELRVAKIKIRGCLLDAVQQHPHTTLVHQAQRMGAPLRDVGERHHGQVPIVSLVRPTERDQGLQGLRPLALAYQQPSPQW